MKRPANQLAPTNLPVRPDKYFIATLYAEVLARTARSRALAQARKSQSAVSETEQRPQPAPEGDRA